MEQRKPARAHASSDARWLQRATNTRALQATSGTTQTGRWHQWQRGRRGGKQAATACVTVRVPNAQEHASELPCLAPDQLTRASIGSPQTIGPLARARTCATTGPNKVYGTSKPCCTLPPVLLPVPRLRLCLRLGQRVVVVFLPPCRGDETGVKQALERGVDVNMQNKVCRQQCYCSY